VDCHTKEIHKIKCPTNVNDFTSVCLSITSYNIKVSFLIFNYIAKIKDPGSGHSRSR